METTEWEARKRKLFTEHLPYELDMFEQAAAFIMSPENKNLGPDLSDWFRRMSALEAFWIHARNLEEFFTQNAPSPDGELSTASAKDFAPDFSSQLGLGSVIEKIHAQVAHLWYKRESGWPEQLGHEIKWVKAQIDADVRRFEGELHADWRPLWKQRQTVQFTGAVIPQLCSSCQSGSWALTISNQPGKDFVYRAGDERC
jgi:hypothetical protein